MTSVTPAQVVPCPAGDASGLLLHAADLDSLARTIREADRSAQAAEGAREAAACSGDPALRAASPSPAHAALQACPRSDDVAAHCLSCR